jgi:hypothetical protein
MRGRGAGKEEPPSPSGPDTLPVVIAWMVTGAVLGMGYSVTVRVTSFDEQGAIRLLYAILLGAIVGVVAHLLERRWTLRYGVELLDHRGHLVHPRHPVVLVLPAVIAIPGLLWLGVVGSLHTHSLLAAEAFGVSSLLVLAGLWRAWCSHRLTLGLQYLTVNENVRGRGILEGLGTGVLVPARLKSIARLNVAQLALRGGELQQALALFQGVRRPKSRAVALVGSALTQTLLGRYGAAEVTLRELSRLPGARELQSQIDEIRLLVALRRDGEVKAFELGQRLSSPNNGDVFEALLVVIVSRLERNVPVMDWGQEEVFARLSLAGMPEIIAELQELPSADWNLEE